MTLLSKKILLLDSLGAALSAFLLGVVLPRLESVFRMPKGVLYFLAITACIFATYSLLSYLFSKEKWRSYLRGIALANLIYCSITIGLTIYFHKEITSLGVAYFTIEVLIVIVLATIEWRASLPAATKTKIN